LDGARSGALVDLIVWGSSTLTSILLEHGLADDVLQLVCPILLGKRKRFFPT
jgi:dihydrofolate reductase